MTDDVETPTAGSGDDDPAEFLERFDREFTASDQLAVPLTVPLTVPLVQRAVRRVLRRPVAWWNREWTNERVARVLVTSASLVTTTVIMMLIVHFNPLSPSRDLLLDNTTPTGGDMGAHVWAPAFLRETSSRTSS